MVEHDYKRPAHLERIVDGDTFELTVDLGYNISITRRFRLKHVDTAEVHIVSKDSDEYEQGVKHRQFVDEWLSEAIAEHGGYWPFKVKSHKYDRGSFGRYLIEIWSRDTHEQLAEALIDEFGDEVRRD